jgi:hypothetical protein
MDSPRSLRCPLVFWSLQGGLPDGFRSPLCARLSAVMGGWETLVC